MKVILPCKITAFCIDVSAVMIQKVFTYNVYSRIKYQMKYLSCDNKDMCHENVHASYIYSFTP